MSKAVLISIQPQWCDLIANGKKTVEVRKTRPKLETPFKVYIYCTKPKMRLVDIIRDGEDVYGEEYHGKTQFIKVTESSTYGTMYGKHQKVIGEFVCDDIKAFDVPYPAYSDKMDKTIIKKSCVRYYDLHLYAWRDCLYAWNISDLVIYDKPKELSEFNAICPNMKPDGTRGNGDCPCGKYTHDFDEITGKIYCTRRKTKPPQSWCYVEEASGNV